MDGTAPRPGEWQRGRRAGASLKCSAVTPLAVILWAARSRGRPAGSESHAVNFLFFFLHSGRPAATYGCPSRRLSPGQARDAAANWRSPPVVWSLRGSCSLAICFRRSAARVSKMPEPSSRSMHPSRIVTPNSFVAAFGCGPTRRIRSSYLLV